MGTVKEHHNLEMNGRNDFLDLDHAVQFMRRSVSLRSPHLRDPAGLRRHCHDVSHAAQIVAAAMASTGLDIDNQLAAVMGMIHDVGRGVAGDARDGIEGYWLACDAGYPPDVARVCLTHMSMGRTTVEAVAAGLINADEAQRLTEGGIVLEHLSLEEQVVGVTDSHVLNGRFVPLEERGRELNTRKGSLPSGAQYNLQRSTELVAHFEGILGHPLGRLFTTAT